MFLTTIIMITAILSILIIFSIIIIIITIALAGKSWSEVPIAEQASGLLGILELDKSPSTGFRI